MVWFCEACQSWYLRAGCFSRRPGHHEDHYWADCKISEAEKDEAERSGGKVCYPDSSPVKIQERRAGHGAAKSFRQKVS